MSVPAAPVRLRSVTVPVDLVIPWQKKHYFSTAKAVPFTRRAFDFWGEAALFPLVRAFLAGCAADQGPEYRYLFVLLGNELAANALHHTRSGQPGGTYTLRADRSPHGLILTCRDGGATDGRRYDHREHHHLPKPRQAPTLSRSRGAGWRWWMPSPPRGVTAGAPRTATCGSTWPTTWPTAPGPPPKPAPPPGSALKSGATPMIGAP
ncbi:ATP-binding protein [Allosalinactinospora lopnorensis]|uniref:ATP-binding protein n=1 Tax=Allosalinactinospora lopnorensis TaxID=1352348 RepID=UPI003084556A